MQVNKHFIYAIINHLFVATVLANCSRRLSHAGDKLRIFAQNQCYWQVPNYFHYIHHCLHLLLVLLVYLFGHLMVHQANTMRPFVTFFCFCHGYEKILTPGVTRKFGPFWTSNLDHHNYLQGVYNIIIMFYFNHLVGGC